MESNYLTNEDEGKYACEASNGLKPDLWVEFDIKLLGKLFFSIFFPIPALSVRQHEKCNYRPSPTVISNIITLIIINKSIIVSTTNQ